MTDCADQRDLDQLRIDLERQMDDLYDQLSERVAAIEAKLTEALTQLSTTLKS